MCAWDKVWTRLARCTECYIQLFLFNKNYNKKSIYKAISKILRLTSNLTNGIKDIIWNSWKQIFKSRITLLCWHLINSIKAAKYKNNKSIPCLENKSCLQGINCVVANWMARHFGGQCSRKLTGRIIFIRMSASFTWQRSVDEITFKRIWH